MRYIIDTSLDPEGWSGMTEAKGRIVVRIGPRTMSKPIAVIDWDGTLVKNTWPAKSYEWMPGAEHALDALLDAGCKVIVLTSRIAPMVFQNETIPKSPADVQGELNYIREMLDDHGFQAIEIWTKPWKPYADAYIDDKGHHYAGRKNSWDNLTEKLLVKFGLDDNADL